jgi:hypothetical protein
MLVKLLGYAPDVDPTILGVLTNCSGVVPSLRGMKGAPTPVNAGFATLAATCQGSAALAQLDGTNRFIAGAPTKLYEAQTSTWSDVSRAAAYTTAQTARWRLAQFSNAALATNGSDTLQASTAANSAFSCVPGAPIAAIVETVGAFTFVFNTSTNSNGWQCAGINGYTSWTPAIATQAASGLLTATPGPITAARRFGTSIVAYKKDSMYLGVYVGPPNIWEFNQIPGVVGAMSQEAVVNIGTPDNPKHVFIGQDDFYIYDGAKPVPIGDNELKQTVFGALLQKRYYACATLHDRVNSRVYFYYPVSDSVNPDKCVVYNYRTGKWGVDDRQIQSATEFVTPGVTYDGLGSLYATYDDLPNIQYDLGFLNSSLSQPAIFSTSAVLQTLTGAAQSTSITTGDLGNDEEFTLVTRVRPRFITKPTSATWTHYYRNNTGDSLSNDSAVSLSSAGTFDVLREARWHRGMMSLVGDWEMASMNMDGEKTGLE